MKPIFNKSSSRQFDPTNKNNFRLAIQGRRNLAIKDQHEKAVSFPIGEEVCSVCLTLDDKYIIVGTQNSGTIWVYELQDLKPYCNFQGVHSKAVTTLAIAPDNKTLFSGSPDGSVRMMDLQTKKILHKFDIGFRMHVQCVKISRDGKHLFVSTDRNSVRVFDIQEKKFMHSYDVGEDDNIVYSIVLTDDGRFLVTGSHDQAIRIFDLQQKKIAYTFKRAHESTILSLSLTSDNRYVVSGSADKTIRIFDILKYELVHIFNNAHDDVVNFVKVSHNDNFIVSASRDKTIRLFDVTTQGRIHSFEDFHSDVIFGCTMTSNSRYIISGSYDKTIKIFDLEISQYTDKMDDLHQDGISSLAISNGDAYMATGAKDGSIVIVKMDEKMKFKDINEAHRDTVEALCFSNNSDLLFSGSSDRSIRAFLYLKDDMDYFTFNEAHERNITALAVTWDDTYLVSGSDDKSIKIFDIKNKAKMHTIDMAHKNSITSLAITNNNEYIVSGAQGGGLKIHSLSERVQKYEWEHAHDDHTRCVVVSSDSRMIITASEDRTIKLWDMNQKGLIHTFKNAHLGEISSMTLSEDDRYIISVSYDKTIKIFDIPTKRHVHTYNNAHDDWINEVKLTCDGQYILTASSDQSVRWFRNPIDDDAPLSVMLDPKIPQNSLIGLMSMVQYFDKDIQEEQVISYIQHYPHLFISPLGWNHFHIVLAIYPKRNIIEACIEAKIPFILDNADKTPLHYLLESDNKDLSVINFIVGNFDEINFNQSQHAIMSSLTDMVPELLSLDTPQVAKFLKYLALKPKSYSNEEARFGNIKDDQDMAFATSKDLSLTHEVRDQLIDTNGNRLIDIRVLSLFMNYEPYSSDMFQFVKVLSKITNEDIFRSISISLIIDYLWDRTKNFHYLLMIMFSIMMILLSVIGISEERLVPIEVILFIIAVFFVVYETFQMIWAGPKVYFSDIYNYVDMSSTFLLLASLISTWAEVDELAGNWVFTITILLNYTKWIGYARVFDQTRRLIRIIVEIVSDMRSFIFMLLFIIFGFSIIFFQFDDASEDYEDSLLFTYEIMFSSFNTAILNDSQIIYFIIITMILSVVLLNMLIAIMGDTFGRVQSKALLTDSQERVSLILESIVMRRVLRDTILKGRYKSQERRKYTSKASYLLSTDRRFLFVVRKSDGEEEEQHESFGEQETQLNRLRANVKSELKYQSAEYTKNMREMETKFERKFKDLDVRIEKFDQKLERLATMMLGSASLDGGTSFSPLKSGRTFEFMQKLGTSMNTISKNQI